MQEKVSLKLPDVYSEHSGGKNIVPVYFFFPLKLLAKLNPSL